MNRIKTDLAGVFIITLDAFDDERGSYKRLWGTDEMAGLGLTGTLNNVGLSYNKRRGTFRGMHYQAEPFSEVKLVQCVAGRIYDIVLDIRRDSPTFGRWIAEELSPTNNRALYIPEGCAHGFQTLEEDAQALYCISQKYEPASARGIRWNDPQFEIRLPLEVTVINDRDANYGDFQFQL